MVVAYPHFLGSENLRMEIGLLGPQSSPSSPLSPSLSPMILTQDEFVEFGMVLGLGTRSTTKDAVDRIGELLHQGKLKNIIGIPTSKMTHEQVLSLEIPLSDLDSHPTLDLAIDGADEVDPHLNLVKGRGGSLLRDKMIESACKKFVVVVDESKLVEHIGASGLAMPVKIMPFLLEIHSQKAPTVV